MKTRAVAAALLAASVAVLAGCSYEAKSQAVTVTGAGATFPAPLYQKWIALYENEHPKERISYQAMGSGAGIELFREGKVDFGATDAVPTEHQLKDAQLFPVAAGSVVVCYNLPGYTGELKLSRKALAGIFAGTIN